ncbi:calcium uniporter protein 2, mitochondrial-like [Typha angustifolia]|uniref:calcium uniporter protein 2, mitochondrial-like n=1 Tax=Typha angustifolia TaxID=59011 RepID=UPI003C2E4611
MAALRRTLALRLSQLAKICAVPSPDSGRRLVAGSGQEETLLRRFLQKRPIFQPALPPDRMPFLPSGDRLVERIRGLNKDRIRLEGLTPPAMEDEEKGMTVEEARKVLRASQMEAARARLRSISKSCVSYSEYVQICCEATGAESGLRIARSLDESGSVIVLGDVVFLRPELVAKAIENAIPLQLLNRNDPRIEELKAMEEKKAEIDQRAEAQVRKELWCGLGFMVAQTAAFMRLTFWELSWDVMEPICFYVTSIYFMAGYAFFLRTSKDPSFEGFFENRLAAKQRRLMRVSNFDIDRFNDLKRACPQ